MEGVTEEKLIRRHTEKLHGLCSSPNIITIAEDVVMSCEGNTRRAGGKGNLLKIVSAENPGGN
jgi:hypothetical protein